MNRRTGRIATWGNIMCDLVFTGLPGLPVVGEEIYAERLTMSVGGGAALTALGMTRLGWDVACMGRLGRDLLGEMAAGKLRDGGVDTSRVAWFGDSGSPGNVTVAMSFPGDRAFVTHQPPGPWPAFDPSTGEFRHHHFAGYEGREDLIRQLGDTPATVSLDTGWAQSPDWRREVLELIPFVDVFLPNEHEALHLTGRGDARDALRDLGESCPLVVVKLGERGAMTKWEGTPIHRPGFSVTPVDTTGAGDAFDSGFLDGWLRGLPLPDCLAWGNACGAMAASRVGSDAGFSGASEVEAFMGRA